MHISGHGHARELASLLLGVQDTERGAKPAPSRTQSDHVEISEHAREIHRIKTMAQEADPARAERVEQIRRAVETGTYDVNGHTVADKVIRHTLTDAVL